MKTVFFYYGPDIKHLYWARDDIIFFNEQGWWLFDHNSRKPIAPKDFITHSERLIDVDPVEIIRRLRAWGPVWSRWCGKGDQYELLLRDALLLVIQIASGLRKLNVSACIMHTGVSHHIDSAIFEIAAELCGVKTVYLYANIFSTRLLPLIQDGSIHTRRPYGKSVSSSDYKELLAEFLTSKEQGYSPKNNYKITRQGSSWIVGVLVLWLRACIRISHIAAFNLRKVIPKTKRTNANIFSFANNSYIAQLLIQFIQQRDALKYLRSKMRGESLEDELKRCVDPILLIAAHYQPEATSFPEGWEMSNHVDIAIELRRKGYQAVILYKEHPGTFLYLFGGHSTKVGMSRSRRYYEQLEYLGCKFTDMNFNLSTQPQQNSRYLPVTIGGTIAMERSLAGFHTIVAGYPWFKGMPGLLYLSEIKSLVEIRPEWVRQDPDLAKRAFNYLDEILSDKTITNVPGIGTGKRLKGSHDRALFAKELDALLRDVQKDDVV